MRIWFIDAPPDYDGTLAEFGDTVIFFGHPDHKWMQGCPCDEEWMIGVWGYMAESTPIPKNWFLV